jgi:hypothetical protein
VQSSLRYIDCEGIQTFQEDWQVTRTTYAATPIPKDISFEEAEATLVALVAHFALRGVIPLSFPLPGK